MQRLAGQGQVGLAERLVLGGVGVDQGCHVVGVGLPAVDQLGLADQLADPVADEVDAEDRPVGAAYELDEALGLQDLALAVAAEVVGEALDPVGTVGLDGLGLGEADGGDLGVGVGDPRDAGGVDRGGAVGGLASSLAFTPVQGIELQNPNLESDAGQDGTKTYFSSMSTFSKISRAP